MHAPAGRQQMAAPQHVTAAARGGAVARRPRLAGWPTHSTATQPTNLQYNMSDEPEPQCEDEERIQRLVAKIDSWLATVEIGGDTYREFDSSHLACFALENSLDDLPSEEIYKLFVDLAVQPEVRPSLSPFHRRHVLHVPSRR